MVDRIQNHKTIDGAGRIAIGRDQSHIRLPTKITPLDTKNSIQWGEEVLRTIESVECSHFYNGTYVAVLKRSYDETLTQNRNRFWLDVDIQTDQPDGDREIDLEARRYSDERTNGQHPNRQTDPPEAEQIDVDARRA